MKLTLILTVAAVALLPVAAQAQKKPTKADADKVVKMISADKAKLATYCKLAKLGDEQAQAEEKKDTKKADDLMKQMDDLSKQLGPEYVALNDGLQNLNEKEAEDIGKAMEPLDNQCGK